MIETIMGLLVLALMVLAARRFEKRAAAAADRAEEAVATIERSETANNNRGAFDSLGSTR